MTLLRLPADALTRPECRPSEPSGLDRAWHWIRARLAHPRYLQRAALRLILPSIRRQARRLRALDDSELMARVDTLRQTLIREGLRTRHSTLAFALIRETAWRRLGMAHHDVQLLGGWAMLRGHIVEMETGEGKTLTATLPAATAALAGIPVHVITVNDYLARRDAELMAPIYRALGLSVTAIHHDLTPVERRDAYAADVVYCTNKELVFDYLRDARALGRYRRPMQAHAARLNGELHDQSLLLRGLHFAIVDEADSVMLDEARTPLILSREAPEERIDGGLIDEVLALAEDFKEGEHFLRQEGQLHLTEGGREVLTRYAESQESADRQGQRWLGRSQREWWLQQALIARHLFQRDHHYLVRDGKVQIIDEHTGRVLADRSWQKGLQQMVERLEGCETSTPNLTLARLTYQRFFRRYHHLAGMTGTAHEVRHELWTTYRQRVVPLPPHRPCRREWLAPICQPTLMDKWYWIAGRVAKLTQAGRPVLVATTTLSDAEALSGVLAARGLVHAVLNARQDQSEAEVIAKAGDSAAITVATSMAGRGTDIALSTPAREAGGLHVIIAGHHDSGRVDRQIAGRCARQGDPGSVEFVLSEQDGLLEELEGWDRQMGSLPSRLRRAQRRREMRHTRDRARLLDADWRESSLLGFSGQGE